MASQVCETLAFINGDDEVKGMEVLEINGDILMSLMEESPSDESDDDRLNSLIRSFEAEISGSKNNMEGHDSSSSIIGSEFASNNVVGDNQSWNMGHVDGHDYLGSSSDQFGVELVDMDFMPSSPCDEKSWCIETFGVENIDGMMGTCYDGFAMEEHGYNNSFWQDTCYNLVR